MNGHNQSQVIPYPPLGGGMTGLMREKKMNEVIEYFEKEDGVIVFTETTAIAICSKCDQSLTLEDHIDWDVVAHKQCPTKGEAV